MEEAKKDSKLNDEDDKEVNESLLLLEKDTSSFCPEFHSSVDEVHKNIDKNNKLEDTTAYYPMESEFNKDKTAFKSIEEDTKHTSSMEKELRRLQQ
ncbi:hypothetical protein NQ314_005975 [Rhamnusium bicolor]|uniref:Uncharacterized protein n=1 Tax=Rhamnusium bicolor TaxID=1586634 RepID=A0AAV8ZCH5_9CUCU|nr:hypothetical protein NQ314_005975 [Rhamnusium bicolor]